MNILAGNYDKYLNLSGGRVEIHKYLWYLVTYKKGNTINPITKKESPHLKVLIVEALSGEKVEIKRLDPSESHKTLGVAITTLETDRISYQNLTWSQVAQQIPSITEL